MKHVEIVLQRLHEHQLYANAKKCEFAMERINFLGHTISGEGLTTDPEKLEAIRDWQVPTTQ